MSVWPSPSPARHQWLPTVDFSSMSLSVRRFDSRRALWLGCLICVLIGQGIAITQSYLWAAPLLCLLLVALATNVPLVPSLGLLLLVRILTDNLAGGDSRHSSSVNLSAAIAGLYILLAVGLLLRHHRAVGPAIVAALWLSVWTIVATKSHGASTLTVREGVREASIVALAVIVFNSQGRLTVPLVTRLIQLAGIASGLVALYQLATHGGQLVGGQMRSNGTFSQPNDAAVFFALPTMGSVWRYVNCGRRWLDACFATIFAAAAISTFSLGGLACLLAMLVAFGLLRPGSARLKLGFCAVAVLIVAAFLATPLGAERLASESSTNLSAAGGHGQSETSLGWRFFKWRTLLPEWEAAPLMGQGLGTTITSEGNANDRSAGLAPHNEPLRYLVETGAVGVATLFLALVYLLRRLARRRRLPGTSEVGTLGMAIVLGLLVNAIAANTLLYTPAVYAAALTVAAVLASPIPHRTHAP